MRKVTLPLAIVEEARIWKADGYGFRMTWNLLSSQYEPEILIPVLNFQCRMVWHDIVNIENKT